MLKFKLVSLSLIITLAAALPVFSQYAPSDKDLVITTFNRIFNEKVIDKYLYSASEENVNAALLSISQSDDKKFISKITELNFNLSPKYICFALSQLGTSNTSTRYLLNELDKNKSNSEILHYCLSALGNVGSKSTLNHLVKLYSAKKKNEFNGISIALYNFYSRGIKNDAKAKYILLNELTDPDLSLERRTEAAFAAYRTGLASQLKNETAGILADFTIPSGDSNMDAVNFVQYLLADLRKADYFPSDTKLFNKILDYKNFVLKIETIKALTNYKFKTEQELEKYFSFINDNNSNVTRQLASSLKDLDLNKQLSNKLKTFVEQKISDKNLSANTRGELYLSLISFNPQNFKSIEEKYSKDIGPEYYYKAYGKYAQNKSAVNFLIEKYKIEPGNLSAVIIESLVELYKKFPSDSLLASTLINTITSNKPAVISIVADNLSEKTIENNKERLKNRILTLLLQHGNDSDYYESLISVAKLSAKVGDDLHTNVLKQLKGSAFYALRKYGYEQLKTKNLNQYQINDRFTEFWNLAFKYKGAKIYTTHGSFNIEFLPGFAPVSVGNFCYLALQGEFRGLDFHRVVPGFVIQGGDPTNIGYGGPGYFIVSEFSPLQYKEGMVGMARSDKDTEGSQWFVTTGYYPHLNGKYSIFGIVDYGLDKVESIDQGDKIQSIKLLKR